MNKEKLERYLKKTHFSLTRGAINTSIIIAFISNVALYYFFRNNIETIISAVLFILFSITLIRNRNYLWDYESSLLIKTHISGYLFWILLMFVFLLQLKFKLSLLLFIIEIVLIIISFILAKKSVDKTFEKDDFTIDFNPEKQKKTAGIAAAVGVLIFSAFRIVFPPPLPEKVVWYILCLLLFVFVFFTGFIFAVALLVYLGYLKYFGAEE